MKTTKYKLSAFQIVRRLSQILFFIFLPTLFSEVISGVKAIYISILEQNFNLSVLTGLVGTCTILIFTILLGRFFCGWICMFGSLGDWIYSIRKLIFKKIFVIPEKVDQYMKYIKFIVLGVFVIAIWTFNIPIVSESGSSDIILMVILAAIIIASSLVERFFCRYLCPLGALFSILSKLSLGKISKPTQKCGSCKVCTKNCAMGIALYNKEEVRGGECINCMRCVEVCPRKNTAYTFVGTKIKPMLVSVITVSLIAVVYNFVDFDSASAKNNTTQAATVVEQATSAQALDKETMTSTQVASTQQQQASVQETTDSTPSSTKEQATAVQETTVTTQPSSTQDQTTSGQAAAQETTVATQATSTQLQATSDQTTAQGAQYADGTYEGSGTGFRRRTTRVSVVIKNGQIASIETLSTGDDAPFYNRAFKSVTQAIIGSQSSDVDSVSGATYSSDGIMEAVEDALNKAKVSN